MACHYGNITIPCNTVAGSINFISQKVAYSYYGYNVWKPVAYAGLAIFAVSAVIHLGQAIRAKMWWLIYTFCAGAILEVLGWGGRAWSANGTTWIEDKGGYWNNPYGAFVMQLCCTVIAPAFFAAADYILLGVLIRRTGSKFSSVTPRSYTIVFCTCDLISLIVQGAGGGIAGTSKDNKTRATLGANIIVGGIFFQLAVMFCFTLLLSEYIYRITTSSPVSRQINLLHWAKFDFLTGEGRGFAMNAAEVPRVGDDEKVVPQGEVVEELEMEDAAAGGKGDRIMLMLSALTTSTILIFARSIYRSIELLNGWSGPIVTNQMLFTILDGLLMALAVLLFNVIHPSYCLRGPSNH